MRSGCRTGFMNGGPQGSRALPIRGVRCAVEVFRRRAPTCPPRRCLRRTSDGLFHVLGFDHGPSIAAMGTAVIGIDANGGDEDAGI